MTAPKVSFQVRLRSAETLATIAARVGAALGCELAPAFGHEFEPGEAMQGSALGLVLDLIGEVDAEEGAEITYVLRGLVRPDIEAELDVDAPTISISEYVLAVLHVVDDDGWYIADRTELLAEAGLDDQLPG